ncbi:poly-gamma-glutamate biosynthesis protein PgsC/CapC [Pseudoalteromonas sp. T1lg65]|uniref:poly-gamma-glutamate biosynthesis protein PgsC/CapC n=1 Tax=Pseudoalteromonas sp. T1lg65 TaxID=2077101 RepID=UPI003F7B084C
MDWTIMLFPSAGGLGQSVITSVWVGVLVVSFFNLRFGFPLTGLVVPGYLVPLFIVSPVSAWVVIVESIVVYALMRFSAKTALEKFGYAEMFGRDRFFAIVLLSILVRVVMDVLIWPPIADTLAQWDITFHYASQLHSLGLIIIALVANTMWNGGFRYGVKVSAIQILVTYLLVRFVLMQFTNFNIENLALMYEGIASSIIASPKAYIILVITAFLASRANIKYGWEFNGIMLPALLALQIMQPSKLLTSLIETSIILIVGSMILRFTRLKHANIEGARLLLFFFNIAFIYKLALNYAVVEFFPTVKVTDTFAFGYMLSTLLALKIYQKDALGLVIRSTFQTSIVGGFIAIAIGFAIMIIPSFLSSPSLDLSASNYQDDRSLQGIVRNYKSRLYTQKEAAAQSQFINEQQRSQFRAAMRLLIDAPQANFPQAQSMLAQINFNSTKTTSSIVIEDASNTDIRGLFVLSLTPRNAHIITVPYPTDERLASESAILLFDFWQPSALALGGASSASPSNSNNKQSPFYQDFISLFEEYGSVQLREYTRRVNTKITQLGLTEENKFWVYNQLPDSVSQSQIRELTGIQSVQFGLPDYQALPSADFNGALVELYLDSKNYSQLLSSLSMQSNTLLGVEIEYSDQSVHELVDTFADKITTKNSDHFSLLTPQQAALWEYEILRPLFELVDNVSLADDASTLHARLRQLNSIANLVHYQINLVSHQNEQYVVLQPNGTEQSLRLGQGMYVFNLSPSQNMTIQVPRPLLESHTIGFASDLFTRTKSRVLLLAGAHPQASDYANVLLPESTRSLFNVVHQSTQRFYPQVALLNVQIRSHGMPASVRPTALALQRTVVNASHQQIINRLQQTVAAMGADLAIVAGQASTRGLELSSSAQSGYQLFTKNSELAAIWLASDYKKHYSIDAQALYQRLVVISRHPQAEQLDIDSLSTSDWNIIPATTREKIAQQTDLYAATQHLPSLWSICSVLAPPCDLQVIQTQHHQLALSARSANKLSVIYFPRTNRLMSYEDFLRDTAREQNARH